MHLRAVSVVLVTNKTLRDRAETQQSIRCIVPNVNMLCCFDDKGHFDCIVDLATVLGEALAVDVTHTVTRNTAVRTPNGHKTTMNANAASMHLLSIFVLLYIRSC